MAEENSDGQEKTEEPSQRKIDKQKEDGKVLTSKEMFVFSGIAGAFLIMYFSSFYLQAILYEWGDLFVLTSNEKLDDLPLSKVLTALFFILKISLFVGIPMLIIVLATQFAVGGINFAPKALNFKGNRINPLSGIKRMFSLKSLVELGKALLKVSLLFSTSFIVIYFQLPSILRITDGGLKNG
jgi:flagellar biosynthetic protein FlhB